MFDICVPSWNSLDYLKILHRGVKRNTRVKHNFLVHDNGSEDGTRNWLFDMSFVEGASWHHSDKNEGFAGVNHAIALGENPYIIIMNSDMYPLPGWDLELLKEIKFLERHGVDKFILSCCLIEPLGNNPEYVISYHGHTADTFDEEGLLKDYMAGKNTKYKQYDTTQYSHPIVLPRKMWEDMGGFDSRYFPGWSIDHDIPAEAYKQGCRTFKMLTKSRVYHFISKTFTQLPLDVKNRHGEDVFEDKWGISVKEFRQQMGIAQLFKEVGDGII